jgi:hypothetical protein
MYCTITYLTGLIKTKIVSQDNRSAGADSNQELPEYEAGVRGNLEELGVDGRIILE